MEKIGFIGLGIMGKPMSKNLLKAGYSLTVYDLNAEAIREVIQAGASEVSTCQAVAEKSDIIITMLPDSPQVEQVVFGENGVLAGVRPGMLFIDMSTIAPATSQKVFAALQEKDVMALDAPVSGGPVGAEAGTLSIMVGGTRSRISTCRPDF